MATFSDMVTLLLTFFVMLTSMANFEDVGRVEAVIQSIKQALTMGGFEMQIVNKAEEPAYTDPVRHEQAVQPTVAKLRQAMAKHISDDVVRMSQTPQEVRVRLEERVFFKPGSAELHPAAYALLSDLGHVLAEEEADVRIEGYADGSGDERANWQLSSDRSMAVVLALRERGPVPGDQLEAVALGSFHPGADIGENKDWNRRIEIVLRSDGNGAAGVAERVGWMEAGNGR